jgi:ketosteroid isomerase-like protein
MDDRVALTKRGFQLYAGGDVEGLLEMYSPDVVVTAPDFMNAGPFRGHAGLMEWMRRWNEAWESLELDVREVEPIGERHVVATVLTSGHGRGSGVPVQRLAYWVIELRNRLATYVEVLASRDGALELARRREGAD